MTLRIGVDTGGTHTDCFVSYGDRTSRGKASTTHYNLSVGFLQAVETAVSQLGLTLDEALREAEQIKYSTTVGLNALIERTGPKLGLITTHGQEQTIHIGRAHNWADGLSREEQVDRPRAQRPISLIPPELRVGVRERVDCFGEVVMPLRPEEVRTQIQYLVDQGVRGFVVCLLWSFMNPVHERMIREIIRDEFPDVYLGKMPVLLSSEVAPKICEYKRSMTTILDGYLRNVAEEHFLDLTDDLRGRGYQRPLLVVRSTGGVASVSRTRPINLYGAGPVAGIMGGSFLSKIYNEPNVLVTDMGGTSFDLGMILDGQARVYDFNPVLDRWRIALPIIASYSIGAGGGSIASVDEFGHLKVGPRSAGAMPGPACYDKGGQEPCVTDADLVLGYLNPDNFLGGKQRLNKRRAVQAIQRRVAGPLGISVEDAAARIKKLIDGVMGQEIFKQTAMKGYDPREFTLYAFGGAGPVHCCGYGEYADVPKIRTFPFAPVFNAFGATTMDVLQTYEKRHRYVLYDPVTREYTNDYETFNQVVGDLLAQAARDMTEEGFNLDDIRFELELDMTYARQIHSTRIAGPLRQVHSEADIIAVCDAFNTSYAQSYGQGAIFPEGGIVITDFVVHAIGPIPPMSLPSYPYVGEDAEAALSGHREVYWQVPNDFIPTPIYSAPKLQVGNVVNGPAIVEAPDTVYVIPHGRRFTVDQYLNGVIEKVGSELAAGAVGATATR